MKKPKQTLLFVPKRLVFDGGKGPEGGGGEKGEQPKKTADQIAAEAKDKAIGDAMKKEGDVGDIKDDAKKKVDSDEYKDAEQTTKDAAKAKLDKLQAEFEQAKAYITLRTQVKTTLDQFKKGDTNWQFENMDLLEKAKADLAKNKYAEEALKTEVDTKITEVQKNADTYYSDVIAKAGEQVTTLSQNGSPKLADIAPAFDFMSKLQNNKLNKFKGAAADKQKDLGAQTDTNIKNLLQTITDAQGKLSEDEKKTFDSTYGGSLKIAKISDDNFDKSRGKEGWQEGADQYMAMSVAMGKAISAKESIPRSDKAHDNWYVNSAEDLSKWGPQYAATVAIYKQALADFAEGQRLSPNKELGDAVKAKTAFDKARTGFLAVKAAADNQKETEANTEKEQQKTEALAAQTNSQKAWDEKIASTNNEALKNYARKLGGAGGDEANHWGKAEKLFKDGNFKDAKTEYEASKKGYEQAATDYQSMLKAGGSEINRAIDNIGGIKNGTIENYQTTVANYLNNPAIYNNNEDLGAVFKSLAFKGMFAKDGNDYYINAGFSGGKADVKITMEEGNVSAANFLQAEARTPKSKEQTTGEIAARINAAKDHFTSNNQTTDAQLETSVKDYLTDTLRRMTPGEIDQIMDQGFPVKYTADGVEKTANVTIQKVGDRYVPVFASNNAPYSTGAGGGPPDAGVSDTSGAGGGPQA